jgi:hypothetical protein
MFHKRLKAQGAVEYLATHIWTLIIIMVALSAFLLIGAFSGSAKPRATPGSCMVYRSDGPGSLGSINLVGVCDGEMPEFVGSFGYKSGMFANPNVTVKSVKFMPAATSSNSPGITLSGWILTKSQGSSQVAFAYGNLNASSTSPYSAIFLSTNAGSCGNGMSEGISGSSVCLYNSQIPSGKWIFVVLEYNGTSNAIGYAVVNGTLKQASLPVGVTIPAHSSLLISTPWDGMITNVQLYNTTLSTDAIKQLYNGGIGAAPINLKNLAGWWPLNADTNDYSGNGNNGYPYNGAAISYTGSYPTP